MAFDIDYACYQAVAGISAYASATAIVKPAGFLFATQDEFTARKFVASRIPNDFPQVRLELRKSFAWAEKQTTTFCMMSSGYTASNVDFGVAGTLQLVATIVHKDAKLTIQTPLELAFRKYLASLWPTLGVVDASGRVVVNGYGLIANRTDEQSEVTGGTMRTVTRVAITVTARPRIAQLTA